MSKAEALRDEDIIWQCKHLDGYLRVWGTPEGVCYIFVNNEFELYKELVFDKDVKQTEAVAIIQTELAAHYLEASKMIAAQEKANGISRTIH